MSKFKFEKTKFHGVYKIYPFKVGDKRGNFIKDFSRDEFLQNNIDLQLKEVFYTTSKAGVLRAIHFQREFQQSKLVRCLSGAIFDVVVDLRKDSPTFGEWESFMLTEENSNCIYIPKGFGHGYFVLKDSIVSYKCDENFNPNFDDGIFWNDPDIRIEWPILDDTILCLSEKDEHLQSLRDFKEKYNGL